MLDSITERKKNIQLINDQVGGWATRVSGKLAQQVGDNSFKQKGSMLDKFKWINNAVKHSLGEIITDQQARAARAGPEGSDDESINAKDFVNNFATKEFVDKNIRVRPVSSVSAGRHLGDDRSEHNSRHNMLGSSLADNDEDERKFNTDVQHDLNMTRKERKDFLIAQEEKRRAELEKAEKKKKKL